MLNALFKEKYSQVSMKRTNAGVNYFRVLSASDTNGSYSSHDSATSDDNDSSENEWSMLDSKPRSAKSTVQEFSNDNAALRESDEVKEKFFEIELEENLFEMRKDTRLVVVDIPGVNEAGASRKYKDYVKSKWNTFDCVVVVMDAKQVANTEEQVELLNDVKDPIRKGCTCNHLVQQGRRP